MLYLLMALLSIDGALFAALVIGFFVYKMVLGGASALAAYLAPGLQARARNHPRQAGIMLDNVRLGWMSMPRAQLAREAEFGSAPAYDHALPEKIAAAFHVGRPETQDLKQEDVL